MLLQLNMLEEGLINHPAVGFGESGRKASELRILLAKIEESEVCLNGSHRLERATYILQLLFFVLQFVKTNTLNK